MDESIVKLQTGCFCNGFFVLNTCEAVNVLLLTYLPLLKSTFEQGFDFAQPENLHKC